MVQDCAQAFGYRPYLSWLVNSCLKDGEALKKLSTPDSKHVYFLMKQNWKMCVIWNICTVQYLQKQQDVCLQKKKIYLLGGHYA